MTTEFINIDAPYSFIGGGKIEESVVDGVLDFWDTCDYLEKQEGYSGGAFGAKGATTSAHASRPRAFGREL